MSKYLYIVRAKDGYSPFTTKKEAFNYIVQIYHKAIDIIKTYSHNPEYWYNINENNVTIIATKKEVLDAYKIKCNKEGINKEFIDILDNKLYEIPYISLMRFYKNKTYNTCKFIYNSIVCKETKINRYPCGTYL